MLKTMWIHSTQTMSEHYQIVDDFLDYLNLQKEFALPNGGGRWFYANFLIPDNLFEEDELQAVGLRKIPAKFDAKGKVVM